MANLSNINNILRVSSLGVGINKNNTGPSELDIESAGADMIDMTRTGQKTYRFAISGASAFSLFDVAANADRLVINSAGNATFAGNIDLINNKDISMTDNAGAITRVMVLNASNTMYIGPVDTYGGGSILYGVAAGVSYQRWYTGAVERMRIMPSGNVGIGTTTPSAKLEVAFDGSHTSGDISYTQANIDVYNPLQANTDEKGSIITFTDNYFDGTNYPKTTRAAIKGGTDTVGNTANGFLAFYTDSGGANSATERMRISSTGDVGIGTTPTVGYNLDVKRTSPGYSIVGRHATGGKVGIYSSTGDNGIGTINNYPMNLFTNNSGPQVTLTTAGNVGIGTTSPPSDHRLQIHNAGAAYSRFALTNSSTGVASGDGLIFQMETLNSIIKNQENGSLAFGTNGRETDLFIKSDGNVGIGTTNPNSYSNQNTLTINGPSTARIDFENSSNLRSSLFSTVSNTTLAVSTGFFTIDVGGSERMRITGAGNVGIGTTGPTEKLDVSGTAIVRSTLFTVGNVHGFTSTYGASFFINNSGGTTYFNATGGNVGIGTTGPAAKLDVAGIIRSKGSNNYENILTKEGSTGSFTFTQTELNAGIVDNVSYFIFVSVYRPTTDVANDVGTLLLHGIMPRGGNSIFNTINTLKGPGIAVLTATNSGNSLVITTDSNVNLRCAIKLISIGGTS